MSSIFREMFADGDTTLCQWGGSSSSSNDRAVMRPSSGLESSLKLQEYPQVADALVSLTAIRERARVELARLGQMGATERCWISETERTKREACWSETYKVCSKEREVTNRTAIEANKDLQKHKASVAGEVAIQVQKNRSSLWDAFTSWPATLGAHLVLATMIGQRLLSQTKMTFKFSARTLVFLLVLLALSIQSGLGPALARFSASQGLSLVKLLLWKLLVPQSLQGPRASPKELPAPPDADLTAGDVQQGGSSSSSTAPAAKPIVTPATASAAATAAAPAACPEDNNPSSDKVSEENSGQAPLGPEEALTACLAPWGLSMYAKALHASGFDAEILHMLQAKEREDVLQLIECKPGHRVRFRLFFDGKPLPSASSASASSSNSPSPAAARA